MAEPQKNLKVDFSGGMLILGIFLLVMYFWGEPDLHDAIIDHLVGPQALQAEVSAPQ